MKLDRSGAVTTAIFDVTPDHPFAIEHVGAGQDTLQIICATGDSVDITLAELIETTAEMCRAFGFEIAAAMVDSARNEIEL